MCIYIYILCTFDNSNSTSTTQVGNKAGDATLRKHYMIIECIIGYGSIMNI